MPSSYLFTGSFPLLALQSGEYSSRHFSRLGHFANIELLVRPLIGGSLENAATKYPNVFGYDFLRKYPYFLPSLVPAVLAISGVIFGYFFLEEVCYYTDTQSPTLTMNVSYRRCPA